MFFNYFLFKTSASADSDVFTLGLLFFYLFTKGESPLVITTTFSKNKTIFRVHINLELLNEFRTNTESILFIDLLQKMLQEVPDDRESYENLITHAVFMSNDEKFRIVRDLIRDCFYSGYQDSNEFWIIMMDKNELHMEGSLGEESDEWKDFLAAVSKHTDIVPDINTCSSLVQIFRYKVEVIFL